MALTILTAGVLGAAGTVAQSLRAAHRADQTARAVRLVGDVMVRLSAQIAAGGGCGSGSGTLTNPTGESASWTLSPQRGGAQVLIEISYVPVSRQYRDSIWSFLRCG